MMVTVNRTRHSTLASHMIWAVHALITVIKNKSELSAACMEARRSWPPLRVGKTMLLRLERKRGCGGARGGLEGVGVGLWVCLAAINVLQPTLNPPDDARTWWLVRAEDSGGLWQIMFFMSQSILGTSYDGCCLRSNSIFCNTSRASQTYSSCHIYIL